jgi:hypothetical protein
LEKKMAAQPRVIATKSTGMVKNAHRTPRTVREPKPIPVVVPKSTVTSLPGALAGLGLAIVFLSLTANISFNSAENFLLIGLVVVMSTGLGGVISHYLGLGLLINERPDSGTKIFGGNTTIAMMVHNVFWLAAFGIVSAMVVNMNPDGVKLVAEQVASFQKATPQPKPIPIPSNPGGGRRLGRTAFEASKDEDPNRIKSSPSRRDANGVRIYSGNEVAQQKARDAQVVNSLKDAGFKVDDVVYANPVKP